MIPCKSRGALRVSCSRRERDGHRSEQLLHVQRLLGLLGGLAERLEARRLAADHLRARRRSRPYVGRRLRRHDGHADCNQ